MSKEHLMKCPHCHHVADIVWIGYGKDWVMCHHCQRRIRWSEVEMKYLLRAEKLSEAGEQKALAYH